MKVCMIVYNNVTKDQRVLREAATLQAAGHMVDIVGIPDADAAAPVEVLENGVRVHRVLWQANAYASLLKSAAIRITPLLIVLGLIVWGLISLIEYLLSGPTNFAYSFQDVTYRTLSSLHTLGWADWLRYALYIAVAGGAAFAVGRLTSGYFGAMAVKRRLDVSEREVMLRYADGLFNNNLMDPSEFPQPRSRIPDWLPELFLELLLEPLDWLGGRSGRFVLYRYRANEMAKLVIRLKPDVIHAHDCIALPTAVQIKKALNIPLVYDAHEVYEAAAARRFGIVDYYTRIHRKLLPKVDKFITINQSAARFYRYAYPYLPPALIIRNATCKLPEFEYDGRLHDAAGVSRSQKILLYQGGYTAERGLPTILRAASYMPSDWTLVLMGWGPLAGQLRHIASVNERRRLRGRQSSLSAPKKVSFVPGVPHRELHLWTAGAKVGIIPYENTVFNHWICSPNKLWEFPSAGVPIIVQPFPELRNVVETYGCGWVLPPELTPGTVADLVATLSDEMIAEARMGCKKFIEEDSWEAVYAGRLVEGYSTLESNVREIELPGEQRVAPKH